MKSEQTSTKVKQGLRGERIRTNIVGVIMLIMALIWLVPIYFMGINSFKPFREVVINTAAFPQVSFKLTEKSLETLKKEGVPDDVVEKLQGLLDVEADKVNGEEQFLKAVTREIGKEDTETYQDLIVKHASKVPYTENFTHVWEKSNYWTLFLNSVFITTLSLIGIILVGSMTGYKLARSRNKWSNILLSYFILTLIIPFQSIMIPLVKVMRDLFLIDSRFGLILVYMALNSPLAIFLYQAGVRTIPVSLEEAATIDGAGPFRTFFTVIFPLLKPVTSTIIILQSLFIWNDFLLPLITLQSDSKKTIPIGISAAFFGQYSKKWNLGITAMLLGSLPMILLYLFMQRHIIRGITSGATKG